MSFLRNREDLSIRDRKAGVLDASRYGRPVAQLIRSAGRLLSDDSRLDESSSGDPSASCSPAVGYQTDGLDNKGRNSWSILGLPRASAVKTAGSLVLSQARPAVWFQAPCSIQ